MPKIVLVTNADWYFLSHRVSLARALEKAGYEVIVVAEAEHSRGSEIEQLGFRFIRLPLARRSASPVTEMATVKALAHIYRTERPQIVHHITIKPVIYGSLVARAVGVRGIVNTVPGLGYMFTGTGIRGALRRRTAMELYRVALRARRVVCIFQNPEDRALFVSAGIVDDSRSVTIAGSGVDLAAYSPASQRGTSGVPIAVLPARLLWDKGIAEVIEASRILRSSGIQCRIVLVGRPDVQNPSSVPEAMLRAWVDEGVIEWWGFRPDMTAVLREADIVVLPSYREGVPKVLLEAAAAGLPIVATDVPGCREVVQDGVNGILVPPRDPASLAEAISRLVSDSALRGALGRAGREIAVQRFGDDTITAQTLAVYRSAVR